MSHLQQNQSIHTGMENTTGTSPTVTLPPGVDVMTIWINISAFSATSIQFTVQAIDPFAGGVVGLLTTTTITGTGERQLFLGPPFAPVANQAAQVMVPGQFNVRWIITGAGSVTFSVVAEY